MRCFWFQILLLWKRFNNEGLSTSSSEAQEEVEATLESIFKSYDNLNGLEREPGAPHLLREQHKQFALHNLLYKLSE